MRKEEFRKNLFFFRWNCFELGLVIYVNGIRNLIIENSDSCFVKIISNSWLWKKFKNTSCLARKPLCFLTPVMGAFIFQLCILITGGCPHCKHWVRGLTKTKGKQTNSDDIWLISFLFSFAKWWLNSSNFVVLRYW